MTEEEAFAMWYRHYPKKKAVGDAKKAWAQTKKDRPSVEQMIEVLKAQCSTDDWRKANGQFIPYPATYLRRLQFLDELDIQLPEDEVNWRSTWQGIVAKGKQFGLTEDMFDQPYLFKQAVLDRADSNVVMLKKA